MQTADPQAADDFEATYNLGIVLLQIGLLKSALEILHDAQTSPEYGIYSAERFSSWLTEKEVPKLARPMGRAYREATMKCLTGSFASDPKMSIETVLYMNVLRTLATCRA